MTDTVKTWKKYKKSFYSSESDQIKQAILTPIFIEVFSKQFVERM